MNSWLQWKIFCYCWNLIKNPSSSRKVLTGGPSPGPPVSPSQLTTSPTREPSRTTMLSTSTWSFLRRSIVTPWPGLLSRSQLWPPERSSWSWSVSDCLRTSSWSSTRRTRWLRLPGARPRPPTPRDRPSPSQGIRAAPSPTFHCSWDPSQPSTWDLWTSPPVNITGWALARTSTTSPWLATTLTLSFTDPGIPTPV